MDTPRTMSPATRRADRRDARVAREFPQRCAARAGADRQPACANAGRIYNSSRHRILRAAENSRGRASGGLSGRCRASPPQCAHWTGLSMASTWATPTLRPSCPGASVPVLPDLHGERRGKIRNRCDALRCFRQRSSRGQRVRTSLRTIREELAALGASEDRDRLLRPRAIGEKRAGDQPHRRDCRSSARDGGAGPAILRVQCRHGGTERWRSPAKDLLSLDLQDVPLAWAQPFIKRFNFSGNDLHGSFVVGARSGGFAVRPVGPLTIGNLSVSQATKPLVRAADISLQASADYTPQGWQAEFAGVTVRSGGATLLTLSARAGQLAGKDQPIKLAGQWTANLPAVLAQPLAADYAVLTGGKAAGDFAASLGPEARAAVQVCAHRARGRPEPRRDRAARGERRYPGGYRQGRPDHLQRATLAGTRWSQIRPRARRDVDAHAGGSGRRRASHEHFFCRGRRPDSRRAARGQSRGRGSADSRAGQRRRPRDSARVERRQRPAGAGAGRRSRTSKNSRWSDLGGAVRIEAGMLKLDGRPRRPGRGE